MKFAKRSDLIIIAILAAIGIGFWLLRGTLYGQPGKFAEIHYNTQLVATVDLTQNLGRQFTLPEAPNVVFEVYEDGSLAFVQSDCPDKVCIHTGKLSHTGEYAACLPNNLYAKIVSTATDNSDTPDLIIG